jgi:uncharacterized C2H2 Zn-finger protein
MAPPYLSRIIPHSQQPNDQAQDHQASYDFSQGATCQPFENTFAQHYSYQTPLYTPGAFVAPSPAMQYIQSPPPLAFDSSPDEPYSATDGFELDYDILNNLSYLDQLNVAEYKDFDLLPTAETFISSPYTDASLFPSLDSFDPLDTAISPQTQRFYCQHGDCEESFARQCELTRHEYKHTRPFACPHCGRAFAEKRRCIQHIQSVHNLATDRDKVKCHLCKYAQVRPDAVKRHLMLKHGIGAKSQSSPSTERQSDKEGARRREKKMRR